jgi:hypothetical protein
MKFKILSVLFLALSVSFISCSKGLNSASNPIVGTWTGTYTIDNVRTREDLGLLSYRFEIKADSTIHVTALGNDGSTYYYDGTWTLAVSDFKAVVSGPGSPERTLSASYSNNGTLSSGKWVVENGSVSGTFQLKRDN